jgi:hypothetical protein
MMRDNSIEILKRIKSLKVNVGNSFIPIPAWESHFIDFGFSITNISKINNQSIFAFSLPTRTFASSLIALGIISRNAIFRRNIVDYDYVDLLKKLHIGTKVIVRRNTGRTAKGKYLGYAKRGEKTYFDIQIDTGNSTTIFVESSDARQIAIIPDEEITLPKSQKGRTTSKSKKLCEFIFGEECSRKFINSSYLECVIVGPKRIIQNEVNSHDFSSSDDIKGNLQELIRVHEFQSELNPFRARVISDRTKTSRTHSLIGDPQFVIFDGAVSYLKWRHYWKKSNWIIILDRCENQFIHGVDQVNSDFIQKRSKELNQDFSDFGFQSGIEFMAFEVKNDQ